MTTNPNLLTGLAALVVAAALTPTAVADPQVLSVNESQVAVDGSVDTFTFYVNRLGSEAVIVLTAPDGASMAFVRQGPGDSAPFPAPEVWRLDGTRVSGSRWIAVGNLDGASADGTWQWSIHGLFYSSMKHGGPDLQLSVGGKAIRAGYVYTAPAFNNPQIWNWHSTAAGTTFQDERSESIDQQVDPVTQPEEDPANGRFFHAEPPAPCSGGEVGIAPYCSGAGTQPCPSGESGIQVTYRVAGGSPSNVRRCQATPAPDVKDNLDGTCTVYNDADHDGTADPGETLVVLPCPDAAVRDNGDGTYTVYDDGDHDGQVDAGETVVTLGVEDADGDLAPDAQEPALCANENPNLRSEGHCDGDDYTAPTAEDLVSDVTWLITGERP